MMATTETERAKPNTARSYEPMKHALDFAFGIVMLVVLAPPMALISMVIRLDSPGPAIYTQKRVGRFGKFFTLYKFRTMKLGTPVLSTEEMQQHEYKPFTRLGVFLRRTSLDELPQIFNIIKGEMSFIGPRPALPSQTDVNTLREQMGVHCVRPGITGVAQVRGRDDLDVRTKVGYDLEYCRRMSFLFDVKVLLQTVGAVLSSRGNK